MKYYAHLIFLLLLFGHILPAAGCTSAIITGKATADGRPLMWKNRDTADPQSYMAFFTGERYRFIALTNSSYRDIKSIWMGSNEAGLCIMNTLSYNLIEKQQGQRTSQDNGRLMKRALEICANVKDFIHLLDTIRNWQIEANFGIIDAQGGAAYFEVSHTSYRMYDANDPSVAPHGYLVRSNYSLSGIKDKGAGYLRYRQADKLLEQATQQNIITAQWLFENLSRSFANPLTGTDLKNTSDKHSEWTIEQNFIARKTSACAVAFQGVKKDEKPEQTIMWLVIGYPPVCPAIPLWLKGAEKKLPRLVIKDPNIGTSLLCNKCSKMHDEVYIPTFGDDKEIYFNWRKLYDESGNGYMQQAIKMERRIFDYTRPIIEKWRKIKSIPIKEEYDLYDWINHYISEEYQIQ